MLKKPQPPKGRSDRQGKPLTPSPPASRILAGRDAAARKPRRLTDAGRAALDRDLERATWWADVRATNEELDRIAGRLSDPSRHRSHADRISHLQDQIQDLIPTAAPGADWTEVATLQLVVCVEGWVALRRGIAGFLPDGYAAVPLEQRAALFAELLTERASRHRIEPSWVLHSIGTFLALGPRALWEVIHRCRTHLGVRWGVAPYMERVGDDLGPIIEELRKMTWRKLAPDLREVLTQEARGTEASNDDPSSEKSRKFERLTSAAGLVLARRLDFRDWLKSLVEGLDGCVDVLPQAVANQMQKDHLRAETVLLGGKRKPTREPRREIEVSFMDVLPPDKTTGESQEFNPPDRDRLTPEQDMERRQEIRRRQKLLDLIRVDPKRHAAWRAKTKRATQRTIAAEAGIDVRTLRRWVRDLECDLERLKQKAESAY